jgi:hypothetical protein
METINDFQLSTQHAEEAFYNNGSSSDCLAGPLG